MKTTLPRWSTLTESDTNKIADLLNSDDREGALEALLSHTQWDGGCRMWLGVRSKAGYPSVNLRGERHAVHRLVSELATGSAPGGLEVHHICAHPSCVKPEHLQQVTKAANVAEMRERYQLNKDLSQATARAKLWRDRHDQLVARLDAKENRIAKLERALAACDPNHPAL